MQNQQISRRFSRGLIAGVSVAALALGGGAAWWATKSIFKPISQHSNTFTIDESAHKQKLYAYWIRATETGIELIPAPVTIAKEQLDKPELMLTAGFQRLLAGNPIQSGYSSAIPQGTKLLGLKLQDNEVSINLSREFTVGGGSAATIARLGQIIYTASSLDPQTKIRILVEGEPLEVLGGEGLLVEQPITRAIFKADFQLEGEKN